MITTANQLLFS